MTEEAQTFEEYKNQNPRLCIPNKLMEEFVKYAKKQYADYDNVNCTYSDDEEEHEEEVDRYIGDSMEALLLFKKFLESKK